MEEQYSDNSIQVLNDIEHIKLRRGMYIGDQGPFQLFSEVLDNSLDEMGEGHGKEIIVNVDTKLNKYTIIDNGRGIPIGMKRLETGEEKETLEVICTKANSSGKFNTNSYKYSAGINGLGITITNALSERFEITTMRGNKGVTFKANNGIKESLEYIDLPTERTGVITSFIPGDTFKDRKIPLNKITDRCRVASALGYRVRLTIDGEEIDTNATIYDLITEYDETISVYKELPLIHVTNELGEEMKVAIRYTSDTSDRYFGYTNMLTNSSGGTHVNELSKAITSAWQEFIDKKKIKLEVDLKNSDYLVGLRAVCAIFISQPEFSSQTKEKLVVNKDRLKELMENFKEKFKEILYDDENLSIALIKRFEEYRIAQNKLLTNKDIMSKIKINNDDSNNIRRRSVSEKLVECTSKKREGTELYIVEGNSACLRWNTKIRLANDTEATIKDVCERVSNGEEIYVYGKAPYGKPYYGPNIYKVLAGGITRKNALLYRVYFDNDTYIDCTEDHKFMTIRRKFKQLKDLTPNDSLSVIKYHCDSFKPLREKIYRQIYEKYCGDIPEGYLVHHKDTNHFNNYPSNLELKTFKEHTTWHNQHNIEIGNTNGWLDHIGDPTPLNEYWSNDPEGKKKKLQSEKTKERFNNTEFGDYNRAKTSEATKIGMSKMTKEQHKNRLYLQSYNVSLSYYKDLIFYRKLFDINTLFDRNKLKEQRRKDGNLRASGMYLYPDKFMSKYNIDNKEELLNLIKDANHRITKVECLNIYEDVYDIEVDEVHNYCLFNDIIVHNCGPFVKTRNKETQAVLPLRGKILNVTNKKVKDAIKNKEICDIANCCGAGIGANNDASKSRYEKVIISADADVDGEQITCLLLSVFVNMFPDMIKQGRVFLTYPPLYAWKTKNGFDGCMNIEDIPEDVKDYSRIKGLGEFNDDELKYFLVNPETRYLAQVEYPSDVDKFNEILGTSNGRYKLMKDLGIIK